MLLALAQFDVREGNRLVWTSEKKDLQGIEFEMIPSGLHHRDSDVIYFRFKGYIGCAVYRAQTTLGTRADAKMYALAALEPALPWSMETALRNELEKVMAVEDPSVLPDQVGPPDSKCHPVLSTTHFLQYFGALVFELWKAGLARTRLMLFDPQLSVRDCSQFTYLISRLATIPSDVRHMLPSRQQSDEAAEYPCFYNVTLQDLGTLQKSPAFVATTTDELLTTPSRDACDIVADRHNLHLLAINKYLVSTWRDRHRFAGVATALDVPDCPSAGLLDQLADALANSMMWWASAGESAAIDAEDSQPLLSPGPEGVALVGQFHAYTRHLIRVFARLAESSDGVIRVGATDMASMGLDICCAQDRRFIERFSLVWWDRPVWFGGCCG